MKLRFTPSGRTQFLSTVAYIHQNPQAAARFRRRAEHALRRLERYPESGRLIPEFPDLRYREVLVSPYRFFYKKQRNRVWIVAVWHGAQLPEEPASD